MERAAVSAPEDAQLPSERGRFCQLSWILFDVWLSSGVGVGEAIQRGFIIPSFCKFPLPPHHCPTPLVARLQLETHILSVVLCFSPSPVKSVCFVLMAAEALRSGPEVGKERGDRCEVKSKGMSMPPVLSTPTTTSSSKLTVLLYSSELLFIRAINSLSQSFLKCISSSVPFHKHLSRAWLAISSASFLPHIPIRLEPQPNWMSLPPVLFPPYALRCCSSAAKIQRGLILHTQ